MMWQRFKQELREIPEGNWIILICLIIFGLYVWSQL